MTDDISPAKNVGPSESHSFQDSLNDLIGYWEKSPQPSTKISSYFPIYVKLFNHLRGQRCTFIETGILDGGSLFMWRSWLGDQARVIGIDLNPDAIKWRKSGFEVYIGDQGDPTFWGHLFAELGEFDVLLDDGGHQSFQQIVTAYESLRAANKECIVVIEDTATSFMKDFRCPSADSFLEFSKSATDCVVGRSFGMYQNRFPENWNQAAIDFFKNVFSIQFFNGVVSFHVDPSKVTDPVIVRNKGSSLASDFRYEGKDNATVEWPNVLRPDRRRIEGGHLVLSKNKLQRGVDKFKKLIR